MSKVIGFDPGFGNCKAAIAGSAARVVVFPAQVGVGRTELGLLSEMQGSAASQARPAEVAFGGVTYLVGDGVARYARPLERMDFGRLAEGPELRAFCYAALAKLLGTGTHMELRLVVGLPVEVMVQPEQARATRRTLRQWLVGTHEFTLDEAACLVEIAQVDVLAQPAGSYFAWGLDSTGQWVRGGEALQAATAILDLGFNTVDLLVVEAGEVVARFTGGGQEGMRQAAQFIARAVQQTHRVRLSLYQADQLLRADHPTLTTPDGPVDLAALVSQARAAVASGVVMLAEQQWGNARQFRHLLLTGGGALALRDELARHYPHGTLLADAATANAAGLARYGQRLGER